MLEPEGDPVSASSFRRPLLGRAAVGRTLGPRGRQASETNASGFYDEQVVLDLAWNALANGLQDRAIKRLAGDFVRKARYDDARTNRFREPQRVAESEVCRDDRRSVGRGVGDDLLVRAAPQPDVSNVLGVERAGAEQTS